MSHYKLNEKDIFFILKEQLKYGELSKIEKYSDFDEELLDMTVTQAIKFAKSEIAPLQEIGEKWGAKCEDGQVKCAPEFKKAFRTHAENGWLCPTAEPEWGGQGLPEMMHTVIEDLMCGACQSFNMCPSLTFGAAHLIVSFATEELKKLYVPNMLSGQWAGTMVLTEPGAGTNLAALRTTATREGDHFKIKGSKIFISWGEHDLAENIIHLVLARIEGAPEGVKGISLFVVPKIRINSDGSLAQPNDVKCGGVEKKLGLHASPTCQLNFGENDDCIGWLCGQENSGLAHMFQMMNGARINTGVSGMAIAGTAYQNALAYAKERVQGPDVSGKKSGWVPIIEHPDVRRMLLWMKAMVDGMRSMIYAGAYWLDLSQTLTEGADRDHCRNLIDFMTPIIKAYCSDMGFRVCETAIQCLGGYGYCADYPLEQYLRDAKIMSLYEGTNGVQSLDLMGRKMTIGRGAPFLAFKAEIEKFCSANRAHPELGEKVASLAAAAGRLFEASAEMTKRLRDDPLQWASYTYPALQAYGEITMAWRLLDLARISCEAVSNGQGNDFHRAKILQALWFVDVTLPHTLATIDTCLRNGREILDMPENGF